MALDIGLALVLVIYLAVGWWRGALAQVVGFVAIVAAWVAGPTVAPHVQSILFAHGHHGVQVQAASAIVAALLVIVAVYAVLRILPAAFMERSSGLKTVNRSTGAILGFSRGAVTLYLLLCATAWLEPGLVQRAPAVRPWLGDSVAMSVVRRNNLLIAWRAENLDGLRRDLLTKRSEPSARRRAKAVARKIADTSKRYHPASF